MPAAGRNKNQGYNYQRDADGRWYREAEVRAIADVWVPRAGSVGAALSVNIARREMERRANVAASAASNQAVIDAEATRVRDEANQANERIRERSAIAIAQSSAQPTKDPGAEAYNVGLGRRRRRRMKGQRKQSSYIIGHTLDGMPIHNPLAGSGRAPQAAVLDGRMYKGRGQRGGFISIIPPFF